MEPTIQLSICTVCHQPLMPAYYFCPNCGTKVQQAPLSTTLATQAWIYASSIALPLIAFLFVSHWPAMKYIHSKDPRAKRIGQVAIVLLILSTVVTIWLSYSWTKQIIKSTTDSINTDFSGL